MKTIFYSFFFALILAVAQAGPVLRGLKSCNAGCTSTFSACVRVPGADKPACKAAKKMCQTSCKASSDVVLPLVEEEEVVEEEKVDAKELCMDACTLSKKTCMAGAKGKEKKLCKPAFFTCKKAC